ncbi:MAG: matrixin family metalloprotease [Sediminibacterium sp.]|nr:matrixin family metalloprotease [Sediminibacterium sp.]MDP3128107.1 matrixin family metalloprotease [Sediminibacterium sp.]
MKRIISLLSALVITSATFSQIKYDDGPIVTIGNFVTVGTWGRNNITFSFQNGTDDIPNNDEQNAIRQAFQIWADYGNLNFTEVTNRRWTKDRFLVDNLLT